MPPVWFLIALIATLSICHLASAATYFISPEGDDSRLGTTATLAWKSCNKVNATRFAPGDRILFERGGKWRGRLAASSDGGAKSPIVYDAYGTGDQPRFLGSDPLENARFTPAAEHKFAYSITTETGGVLVDGQFVPASWAAGVLTITTNTDPRSDGKIYTACVRGNVIFSNHKSHLVFRNLVVDETAGQLTDGAVQGYGVRIEGSTDVLLEDCEAYRCGRHHFAVINSTGFVGRRLRAAWVVPNMPGDNTPFVSYADGNAPVAHCTSDWIDIAADHLDDGNGGHAVTFVSHGDQQGAITIADSAFDTKVSLMSSPVTLRHVTLGGNASIENFGKGVTIDSATLLDSSAIDQYGSDGMIQNCLAHLAPTGNGPTGYASAIVIRDKAMNNTVRFNTLVTGRFAGLYLVGRGSRTRCVGNIMQSDSTTIGAAGPIETTDLVAADENFYSTKATFVGKSFRDWQSAGFDLRSAVGDPEFVSVSKNDFHPRSTSPVVNRAAADAPTLDFAGSKRLHGRGVTVGAFEPDPVVAVH